MVMKMSLYAGIMVVFLVTSISFASAAALIKTDLERNILIADGVTEYRLNIWADNTGLEGATTDGIQWSVYIPAELQPFMTVTRAEWPDSQDFFEGSTMFWQRISIDMQGQARLVDIGQGKSNQQGYVATYYFTIAPGFEGKTRFDMGGISFVDPDANEQEYTVENEEFTVVKKFPRLGFLANRVNSGGSERICYDGSC